MARPRKSPTVKICVICGNEFPVPNPRNIRDTCSDACIGELRARHNRGKLRGKAIGPTIKKTCEGCNESFMVFPCQLRRRFCTDSCRLKWFAHHQPTGENHPYWTGGRPEYRGPSWKVAQAAARQRDNYTCQGCGIKPKSEKVHVHHIIPFKVFGRERHIEANDLSNLICLCRSCHMKAERKTMKEGKME